jgi:hypothetical protein
MLESLAPEENVAIYQSLYGIEVALREMIIEHLSRVAGPRWYKQRLPEEIRKASVEKILRERGGRWTCHVDFHPIYYTNFSELQQIIERQDNWRDTFQSIFGSKAVVCGTLTELDPIRNKIAHNRRATPSDVQIVRASLEKIASAIGLNTFHAYVARCTAAPSVGQTLESLRNECVNCETHCLAYMVLPQTQVMQATENQWWFDNDYLGVDLQPIVVYYDLLKQYDVLPKARGTGHTLEQWICTVSLPEACRSAIAVLDQLLKQWTPE